MEENLKKLQFEFESKVNPPKPRRKSTLSEIQESIDSVHVPNDDREGDQTLQIQTLMSPATDEQVDVDNEAEVIHKTEESPKQ